MLHDLWILPSKDPWIRAFPGLAVGWAGGKRKRSFDYSYRPRLTDSFKRAFARTTPIVRLPDSPIAAIVQSCNRPISKAIDTTPLSCKCSVHDRGGAGAGRGPAARTGATHGGAICANMHARICGQLDQRNDRLEAENNNLRNPPRGEPLPAGGSPAPSSLPPQTRQSPVVTLTLRFIMHMPPPCVHHRSIVYTLNSSRIPDQIQFTAESVCCESPGCQTPLIMAAASPAVRGATSPLP